MWGAGPAWDIRALGWPAEFRVCGARPACHHEPLMRSIGSTAVTPLLLLLAGALACGLDSQGLLATDAGMNVGTGAGDDDSGALIDDEAGTGAPPAEGGGRSGDDGALPPRDASSQTSSDSGPPSAKDAARDAPSTCSGCVDQMCATQVAACGTGSDCLGYRDCSEACSAKGGQGTSNCSTMCQTKYPAGQATFAALTLCALRCGAGCVAAITTGTP
jgi:hypothetical protein